MRIFPSINIRKVAVTIFTVGLYCCLSLTGSAQNNLPVFKVNGINIDDSNQARENKMEQVLQIFEKVMNDADFKKELLSLTFMYDVVGDVNARLTTRQVVEKIYAGREWYLDTVNNTADIYWKVKKKAKPYFDNPKAGFENTRDSTIYTYTWFFDRHGNLPEVVGSLAHEWSLQLGFEHAFKNHRFREKTVPFAFEALVTKYAAKYADDKYLAATKSK